jgi:AraC-like DNA-binding protein
MRTIDPPSRAHQIQCSYRRYANVPRVIERVSHDDFYTLYTPLSRASLRVCRDNHVLFEGEVRPGMLRLAVPGECLQVAVQSQLRHIELVIPGANVRHALRRAGYQWRSKSKLFAPLARPRRTVARLASALLLARQVKENQRPSYIQGLTDSLLACLVAEQPFQASAARAKGGPLSDAEFQRSVAFADSMLNKKLALDQWAAAVNMEKTEFARRFRERTKQAPYAWFLGRRIERAKELLAERKLSIIEVALKAGFGSQSHFTEAFRRHVGSSPARWRQAGFYRHAV